MEKTIEILVGIPCSGKSTYVKKRIWDEHVYDNTDKVVCISRDDLRESFYGKKYKPNKFKEKEVTNVFNYELERYLSDKSIRVVILDNTHCKEKYIDEYINKLGKQFKIRVVFFDIPLWKAQLRNIGRYIKTGKWIPIGIITQMYKNLNKINRSKYNEYIF